MQREEILKQLSLEEKVALVSGRDFFYTNSVKRLNIPSVSLADGPHGLRKQIENEEIGLNKCEPSTAFPTAACTASGWNDDNLYKMGQAIAKECLHYGVNNLLGPGVNIKRNPLCGRNFEYFSEDPYLAGRLATAQINGVQSQGVGATIKHFALNNSENYRNTSSSYCDNRAMSEIYLKSFEMAVKNARPHSVMCAYNAINGTYASENEWLFKDILRGLWGFSGLVMTDWGATVDRIKSIKAGCDLEMPGDTPYCRKQLFDGVKSGEIDEKELDECVLRIIDFAKGYENNKQIKVDFESHDKLAGEIAEDCAVLMKNDGVLPLNHSEKVCVVGHLFEKMRYQGSGSSMINCTKITTPKDAFDTNGVNYRYAQGYKENSFEGDEKLLQEAVRLMQDCDKILLFIG
ncbi:MAG: glycoside hydrolase family 3 C-terminal domain-containing protein, partial [Clostridia bacterium]|nr:glycoside hydrolase family 3 C-terminal domain-containing protein [Clostridia bacterium]